MDEARQRDEYLRVCQRAARAGGEVLLQWLGQIKAREKAPRDLVTEADLASQRTIQDVLLTAFPEHAFLGEEEDEGTFGQPQGATPCWIVDPLDGTTNFVHQLPNFAVSIGLAQSGQLLVATVYDPVMDECFTASLEGGAFLNGRRLHVSRCTHLEEGLVAASFAARVQRESLEVARFVEVLGRSRAVRRLGSAALNLSYLAAGRLDAYWATSVKPWDVAAGVLLVQEAGGIISDIGGGEFRLDEPQFAAAATVELHRELVQVLENPVRLSKL